MKMITTILTSLSLSAFAMNRDSDKRSPSQLVTCEVRISKNKEEVSITKCRVSKLPKSSENGKSVTVGKSRQ
jgi:hypothetical protein